MSTGRVFSASDAEQQASDAAANYLARATRIVAESVFMERDYRHFPAEFADRFASLIGAVVEVQAREYQSWVLFDRLGALECVLQNRLDDLAACLDKLADRLNPQAVDAGRP